MTPLRARRLVLSPLKWEHDLLVQSLEALGHKAQRFKDIVVFESLNTLCARGGYGKVNFALKTYDYLKRYHEVKEVLTMGGGGALRQGLHPGDVLIGVKIIEHDNEGDDNNGLSSPSPLSSSSIWPLDRIFHKLPTATAVPLSPQSVAPTAQVLSRGFDSASTTPSVPLHPQRLVSRCSKGLTTKLCEKFGLELRDTGGPWFFPNSDWLKRIKEQLTSPSLFGVIASGDEDIMSSSRASELHQDTGADVVAWEGAGGARACQLAGVNYIEIRGVTDQAGESAPEEFKKNLPKAMKNLARTLLDIPQTD